MFFTTSNLWNIDIDKKILPWPPPPPPPPITACPVNGLMFSVMVWYRGTYLWNRSRKTTETVHKRISGKFYLLRGKR